MKRSIIVRRYKTVRRGGRGPAGHNGWSKTFIWRIKILPWSHYMTRDLSRDGRDVLELNENLSSHFGPEKTGSDEFGVLGPPVRAKLCTCAKTRLVSLAGTSTRSTPVESSTQTFKGEFGRDTRRKHNPEGGFWSNRAIASSADCAVAISESSTSRNPEKPHQRLKVGSGSQQYRCPRPWCTEYR